MTLFLTSSPSGCPFEPGPDIPVLDTRNHFVANLRAVWPDHAVLGLAIAADPYAYEQNDEMCHFFAQLGLPGLFHNYHGIMLGVSAGSMNAAHIVYAAPEEPGEAADPHYSRWMNGLGLTETRILPHYQFIRDHVLDGQKVEDIALADSKKRHFLALPDGSYILCADGSEALYGRGWYFADGMMEEINEDEDVLPLR